MSNYFFIVRPWNVDFFLELKELINRNEKATILFFTMQVEAFKALKSKEDCDVVYFPEYVTKFSGENTEEIENEFVSKFGFGLNRLYDLERFKSTDEPHSIFIQKHLECLNDIIKPNSILISLTLDHFVYILTAHLNKLKGGKNICIQPTGFPLNANVVLSTPWDLQEIRKEGLGEEVVQEYIESLSKRPEESIHYMKVVTNEHNSVSSKVSSLASQYKSYTQRKGLKSNYHYLERQAEHPIKSIFNRVGRSKKWTKESVSVDDLKSKLTQTEVRNIFYYPLQLEPEMSTLAYSPFLRNQIDIIRLLSMCLDSKDLIVLKENPKMLNTREESFYLEIDKFPNVVWAGFKENSRDIIRISYKVITVTGTAAIEAACLGIKSMIFGYPPFLKMLYQKPISDVPLSNLRSHMYLDYTKEDIDKPIHMGWQEYSKSVFIGNLIPKWDGGKTNLKESKKLAGRVKKEILDNLY